MSVTGKDLRAAMRSTGRVYGTCVTSTSPTWVSGIKNLGVDFVFIDTEHIPIDRSQLAWMCQAYRALGIPPIVRIPAPDPYQASMAIDAGACGLLAPYIETVDQVVALRGAVKLGPLKGRKLDAVLAGDLQLSDDESEFLVRHNEQHILLLNIESQAGIDALDEMLVVPDVDGVIIGPHDLSINLGVPEQFDHVLFRNAVESIIRIARNHGVGVGNHFSWGVEQQIEWAKCGMNIILNSSDIVAFMNFIGDDLNKIRRALNDTHTSVRENAINI